MSAPNTLKRISRTGTLRRRMERSDAATEPPTSYDDSTAGLHTSARLADGLEPGVALSASADAGFSGIRPGARGFAPWVPRNALGRLRRTSNIRPSRRNVKSALCAGGGGG